MQEFDFEAEDGECMVNTSAGCGNTKLVSVQQQGGENCSFTPTLGGFCGGQELEARANNPITLEQAIGCADQLHDRLTELGLCTGVRSSGPRNIAKIVAPMAIRETSKRERSAR